MALAPQAPQPLKGCPWSTSSGLIHVPVSIPACGKGEGGRSSLLSFQRQDVAAAHNNLCSQTYHAAPVQAAVFSCVPCEQHL